MNDYFQQEARSYSPQGRITWAVQKLLLLTTFAFAGQLVLDIAFGDAGSVLGGPGLTRLAFMPQQFLDWMLWQPVTYMFLHAGLMHLFMNMFWLYIFGPEVERVLGTSQFVKFYLFCGALGVLLGDLPLRMIGLGSDPTVIGASGAVMGVLVAYATVNPERQFFLFPLPIPINARGLVMLVIAMNVVSALGDGTTSVATHFGGMFTGFAYMKAVPPIRRWLIERQRTQHVGGKSKKDKDKFDATGEAVDNIFNFDDEKGRRK